MSLKKSTSLLRSKDRKNFQRLYLFSVIHQPRPIFRLLIKEVEEAEGEGTATPTMMIVVVVVVHSGQEDEAGIALVEGEGVGTVGTVAAVQVVPTSQARIGNKWRKSLPDFLVSHSLFCQSLLGVFNN